MVFALSQELVNAHLYMYIYMCVCVGGGLNVWIARLCMYIIDNGKQQCIYYCYLCCDHC